MQVAKFRIRAENGLAPAGEYFKRIAHALREASERGATHAAPPTRRRRRGGAQACAARIRRSSRPFPEKCYAVFGP